MLHACTVCGGRSCGSSQCREGPRLSPGAIDNFCRWQEGGRNVSSPGRPLHRPLLVPVGFSRRAVRAVPQVSGVRSRDRQLSGLGGRAQLRVRQPQGGADAGRPQQSALGTGLPPAAHPGGRNVRGCAVQDRQAQRHQAASGSARVQRGGRRGQGQEGGEAHGRVDVSQLWSSPRTSRRRVWPGTASGRQSPVTKWGVPRTRTGPPEGAPMRSTVAKSATSIWTASSSSWMR